MDKPNKTLAVRFQDARAAYTAATTAWKKARAALLDVTAPLKAAVWEAYRAKEAARLAFDAVKQEGVEAREREERENVAHTVRKYAALSKPDVDF